MVQENKMGQNVPIYISRSVKVSYFFLLVFVIHFLDRVYFKLFNASLSHNVMLASQPTMLKFNNIYGNCFCTYFSSLKDKYRNNSFR